MGSYSRTMAVSVGFLCTVLSVVSCINLVSPIQAASLDSIDQRWEEFKSKFSKNYDGLAEVGKRTIWEENVKYIKEHNARYLAGLETFSVAENAFSDLTTHEFVRKMNGFDDSEAEPLEPGTEFIPLLAEAPLEIDWRTKGYVTAVKNQKQCGSCWAFSATGSLEGQHFNKTTKLVALSEQNLVDCSKKEGNHGCQGGIMNRAFKYVRDNAGIDTMASYPYLAQNGPECLYNETNIGATLSSWKNIGKGNETELALALAQVGPISVAIDAGHKSFQHYKEGIYHIKTCSSTNLDHGVLVVGYGQQVTDGVTEKYWLVKNSWGKSWGMEGYIKMSKDFDNMCGIATRASYPVV